MTRAIKGALLLGLTLALQLSLSRAAAAEDVDLLLVLAADVSRSVDQSKFELQRQGYAAAISHPKVLEAISSGAHRRIAVCFLEWSGENSQKVVIDWTPIADAAAARRFGDELLEAPRSFSDRTSISAGIDVAVTLLDRAPFRAERRAIDVSGDGDNNSGRDVTVARDEAVAKGITINGLVILTEDSRTRNRAHTHPPGGLAAYYRANVIGGPGAFVIVADGFGSFGDAIIRKLIAEIADLSPLPQSSAQRSPD